MTQIRKKIFTGYQALLTIVLGLMGITSACIPFAAEYGTPNAKFIVKGKIVSATDQKPLKDVQVIMKYDTTKSDANGLYEVSNGDFPLDSVSFTLKFEDVNSADGVDYQPLDTVVTFIDPEFIHGDHHWYLGETSKTLDIELKK